MRAIERGLLWLLLCAATPVWAHTSSLGYLDVRPDGERLAVQWSVSLIDLNEELAVDLDGDQAITWGELRQRQSALAALFARQLQFQQGTQACAPDGTVGVRVDTRQGEVFAVLDSIVLCAGTVDTVDLRYRFLTERNRQHRAIVTTHPRRGDAKTVVVAPDGEAVPLTLAEGSAWRSFSGFVKHGFLHILEGWDHVLFVLVLVMSAMAPRGNGATPPAVSARMLTLLKLVSLFTLAHSLTLALAALQVFVLPTRVVEAGIAASIVVTAANNFRPFLKPRFEAAVVFGFGLLHGMGFATLLNDLLLSTPHRVMALAGFNVGVELGQLAIVLLTAPLLLAALVSAAVRRRVVLAASAATACAGCVWFVDRAF